MSLGERIEAARTGLIFTRHALGDLAASIEKEGVSVPSLGQTRQLVGQATIAFEKALAESATGLAERLEQALPGHGDTV